MTFILRFIGIVTIACIGTGNNPCAMSPYGLRAYLPDGRGPHQPCFSAEVTPPHQAFIRVKNADEVSYNWTGRLKCFDQTNCHLYPLQEHDVIYVDGISNGSGMNAPFTENPIIQWATLEPGSMLANDAIDRSFATMAIMAGTAKTESLKPNEMIITTGTFTVPGPTVRVTIYGTNRYVEVNGNSTVDI